MFKMKQEYRNEIVISFVESQQRRKIRQQFLIYIFSKFKICFSEIIKINMLKLQFQHIDWNFEVQISLD